MSDEQANSEEKKTSEKPVSLNPLNLREALANLLAVKPKTTNEDNDEDIEKEER